MPMDNPSKFDKDVKSIYMTKQEKKMCKQACLDFDMPTLQVFYVTAISWYFDHYQCVPYLLSRQPDSICVSVWLSKSISHELDVRAGQMRVAVSHFIHTAIILFLESKGYFQDVWCISWPGKNEVIV